jgi:ubiquinone/menaquinone biosynthesis C-methylase UbiE
VINLASVMDIPYENEAFDMVVATFAFSGISDGPQAMAEMIRVLAPGWRVVLVDNLLITYTPTNYVGTLIRTFSTILIAQFYTSLGEVNGAFVASMQFGTTTPGLRKLCAGAREAEADATGAAKFDLQFDLNIFEVQGQDSGASTIGVFCMSIIALSGAAAFL